MSLEATDDNAHKVISIIKDIVNSYRFPSVELNKLTSFEMTQGFYLQYGAIDLPYMSKEKVYARFEGHPLDKYLKMEINIHTINEIENFSIIDRLDAAIVTNYAQGLKVEKIRTTKRSVAKLEGEEVVFRGKSEDDSNLSFSWRFAGKPNSGEAPEIYISMETDDKNMEQKLAIWDAVLDSMQVIPQ